MDVIATYILPSIPYIFSSISIVISLIGSIIYGSIKKRKSDQFRIALDINDRLERNTERYIEIEIDSNNNPNKKYLYDQLKRSNAIALLTILEFLSLLINNKEITEDNITKYFKPVIVEETEFVFKEYSDIANDKTMFEELRKLLDSFEKCKLD
jgi:hypothetical protein